MRPWCKPRSRRPRARLLVETLENRLQPNDLLGISGRLLGLDLAPAGGYGPVRNLPSSGGVVPSDTNSSPSSWGATAPKKGTPAGGTSQAATDAVFGAPLGDDPFADLFPDSGTGGPVKYTPGMGGTGPDSLPGGTNAGAPFAGGTGANGTTRTSPPGNDGDLLQRLGLTVPGAANGPAAETGPGNNNVTVSAAGGQDAGPIDFASIIKQSLDSNVPPYTGDPALLDQRLQATGDNRLPAALQGFVDPETGQPRAAGFSTADDDPDPGVRGALAVTRQEYAFGDTAFQPTDWATLPGSPRVELTASIHSPTALTGGPRPVIVFLHGRHSTAYDPVTGAAFAQWPPGPGRLPIPSYQGYDYLSDILASHGYVVVSVSANGINAVDNTFTSDLGMLARAELLQRHLDILRDLNTGTGAVEPFDTAPFGTRFVGKLDLQNIGTMGHSRGGEGVVRHFVYNQSLGSPYGIKAVFALAPVNFQRPVVNGAAFAVLLPYNDGDVSDLQGVHFYDDARYNVPGDLSPKHTFVIFGAGHNFYNTVWSPGDFPFPGAPTTPRGIFGTFDDVDSFPPDPPTPRLTKDQVHGTLVASLGAFFRTYLGGSTAYLPLLRGDVAPPPSAQIGPDQWFVSYHAPDDPQFRRDVNRTFTLTNLDTNTLGGAVTQSGLSTYDIYGGDPPQQRFAFPAFESSLRFPHTVASARSTRTGLPQLRLVYENTYEAVYENALPAGARDESGYYALQFRAGVNFTDNPGPPRNRFGVAGDFTVTLVDGGGNAASTQVSDWSRSLYYPPSVLNGNPFHTLLNGVRIPLAAFQGVDLTNITAVRFNFDQRAQGSYLVTDLAFVDPADAYAGPFVASSTLADNVFTVQFNTVIDAATFTADDVRVTGPGGVPVTVTAVTPVADAGGGRFVVSFVPAGVGTYVLQIGPDVRDLRGNPLDQNFNGVTGESGGDVYTNRLGFRGPRVVAASPAPGSLVNPPVDRVRLTFSTPIDPATFTPDDVVSFTGPGGVAIAVTGITPLLGSDDTQFDLTFAPQTARGAYTLVIGPDIRDRFGDPMDQNDNLVAGEVPGDRFTLTFAAPLYDVRAVPFEDLDLAGQPDAFPVITAADDDVALLDLGANTFNFFGTTYTGAGRLFVSSNGLLTFDGSDSPLDAGNADLTTAPAFAAIAPLWDDWIKEGGTAADPMVVARFEGLDDGDPGNDRLVIQWNRVFHFNGGRTDPITFQVILQLNTGAAFGAITFNYVDLVTGTAALDNGASATVGVKDAGPQGVRRQLISFNSLSPLVGDGRAVRLTQA